MAQYPGRVVSSNGDCSYTVVIPTLVDDPYLHEALESVREQTLSPERVLVMVNGNTAGLDALRSRVTKAIDTAAVLPTSSEGMISGLSEGIQQTLTPYIAFLDADDLWLPDKQEKQISRLSGNFSLDAVHGQARNFQEVDGIAAGNNPPAASAKMFTTTTFRTVCFEKFGLPDITATHHTWLYRWWHQAIRKGVKVASIKEEVLLRRIHGKNSWLEHGQRGHAELLQELRTHFRKK